MGERDRDRKGERNPNRDRRRIRRIRRRRPSPSGEKRKAALDKIQERRRRERGKIPSVSSRVRLETHFGIFIRYASRDRNTPRNGKGIIKNVRVFINKYI